MLSSTVKFALWFGATLIVAFGAVVILDDRDDEAGAAVAKACAGSAPTRRLDHALFNERALSDGADPICAPPG
jgi:hypothetical protein